MFSDITLNATTEVAAALSEHRRMLEAGCAANRHALADAHAAVAVGLEGARQAVAALNDQLIHLSGAESAQVRVARQVAIFKMGLEQAVESMEQLRELVEKAQAGAAIVLNQRVIAAMDEAASMVGAAEPTRN